MTISVTIKVNDGIVVASDSATTMQRNIPNGGHEIINIYDNANKIFNLNKGFPVGAVTAGMGSIDRASISTLSKNLRARLAGEDKAHESWKLDPETYTIEEVAQRAREYLFEEKWVPYFGANSDVDDLHYWVFGFSAGQSQSELWKILVSKGSCTEPVCARPADLTGIDWCGQPEAISRLVLGFSPMMEQHLLASGKSPDEVRQFFDVLTGWLSAPLATDPMPIIDAIELAEFLVYLTVMFSKFNTGAATVGGPIEVAAITRHEGFKWVKRKHYFSDGLNG